MTSPYPPQYPQAPQGYPQAPQGYPQQQQPMPSQQYPQQLPPMPNVPGIPGQPAQQWPAQNVIPAPDGGGIAMEDEVINWAKLREESDQADQPIPVADYPMLITSASVAKANNGKPMIKTNWKIMSGQYMGRQIFRNIVISQDVKNSMRIFFRQMAALGLDQAFWNSQPTVQQIADSIVGRSALCSVAQKEYPPHSGLMDNEIKAIRPLSGAGQSQQGFAPPPMPQMAPPQYQQPQYQQPQYQPQPQQPDPRYFQQPQQDQQPPPPPPQYQPPQDQQRPGNVMVDWPPEEAQQAPPPPPQQYQQPQPIQQPVQGISGQITPQPGQWGGEQLAQHSEQFPPQQPQQPPVPPQQVPQAQLPLPPQPAQQLPQQPPQQPPQDVMTPPPVPAVPGQPSVNQQVPPPVPVKF